jgi:hypothetical protein
MGINFEARVGVKLKIQPITPEENLSIPANFENEIDAFVNQAMQAWNIPGLALAIVKDDQVMLAKGYGVRDMGKTDPVDEHKSLYCNSYWLAGAGWKTYLGRPGYKISSHVPTV